MRYVLAHSAKGSSWEKHKYVKVEDGKYYYPDGYEGGRNIGNSNEKTETVESNEPTGWDNKLFSSFEQNLKGANGKLDPKAVQQMLLFGKDDNGKGYDNFRTALEKAGVDTSKIDDQSLNLMRYKVVEHYKNEFSKEKDNFDAEGNRIKERDGSVTKSSDKKSKSAKSKSSTKSKKETEKKVETEVEETTTKKEEKKKKKSVTNGSGKAYNPGYVSAKPVHKASGMIDPVYVVKPTGLKWNIL